MHGRKREEEGAPGLSPEAIAARALKIAKYNAAKTTLLQMRAARQYDPASYALTAKLIEVNPDFYSLWNFRKEIVLSMIAAQPDDLLKLLESELLLSNAALLKNPKCYSAWHHRLWVLQQDLRPVQAELQLCGKMLQLDARNFHCWNYRRAVAALAKASPESEFEFTTAKINENFSNYSAWHYRTVLIPRIYNDAWFSAGSSSDPSARLKEYDSFLDKEFALVRGAFYVEPEDQSAWLYHRWLLGRVVAASVGHKLPVLGISLGTHLFDEAAAATTMGSEESAASSAAPAPAVSTSVASSSSASLARQLRVFRRELHEVGALLEVESECKWALLTSAILQAGIVSCLQAGGGAQPTEVDDEFAAEMEPLPSVAELTSRMRAVFERLQAIDPMRDNYYRQVRQRFMQQDDASV